MLQISACVALAFLLASTAYAGEKKLDAPFVGDGIYSPGTGCQKLEEIESGKSAPNIATYPLTLTREGTGSWEGGCEFSSIRELEPNTLEAKLQCSEGADEYAQTVTFKRLDADRIEVRSGSEALVYQHCKGLKGKVER